MPRRLHLDGRGVDVAEIIDQWPGRNYVYFKVKGADGNIYILRLDETNATWEVVMFETPQAEEIASQPHDRKRRPGDGAGA
jgi:hypothetical protein